MSDLHYWIEDHEKMAEATIQKISNGAKLKEYPVFLLPYLLYTDRPMHASRLFKIEFTVGHSAHYTVCLFEKLAEVRDYISEGKLFGNTVNACKAVLTLSDSELRRVFGNDGLGFLHSFATLFDAMLKQTEVSNVSETVFGEIINRFFKGEPDAFTLECIENLLNDENGAE